MVTNDLNHGVRLFPKALRRVLPENFLNTDTSTLTLTHWHFHTCTWTLTFLHVQLDTYAFTLTLEHWHFYTYPSVSGRVKASNGKYPSAKESKCKSKTCTGDVLMSMQMWVWKTCTVDVLMIICTGDVLMKIFPHLVNSAEGGTNSVN